MRFLILLEQTEEGFAVQVPDLAVITVGKTLADAKIAAREAIRVNLDAYGEAGQPIPEGQPILNHLENPEFRDLFFAYIDVPAPKGIRAA